MYSKTTKENLRTVKTKKALNAAIFSLLERTSFKKITISEICKEALIGRATFYSYYVDKYDLLKYWMQELLPKIDFNVAYEQIEKEINSHINKNKTLIKNLVYEADDETLDILFNAILSALNLPIIKNVESTSAKNIVLSNFCAGGMTAYLLWQIKNDFPSNVPLINKYIFEIINKFHGWQLN